MTTVVKIDMVGDLAVVESFETVDKFVIVARLDLLATKTVAAAVWVAFVVARVVVTGNENIEAIVVLVVGLEVILIVEDGVTAFVTNDVVFSVVNMADVLIIEDCVAVVIVGFTVDRTVVLIPADVAVTVTPIIEVSRETVLSSGAIISVEVGFASVIEENNGVIKDVETVDETVVLITLFSSVTVLAILEVVKKVVFDWKAVNKSILALELDAAEIDVTMEGVVIPVKLGVIRAVLTIADGAVTGNARVGAVATVI